MPTVYIETSIVSHATARPSTNIEVAAMQLQAREWWATQREKFTLLTSQLTIDEASAGDPNAARERLQLLDGLPLADIGDDVLNLSQRLLEAHTLPEKAATDALHVAAAAVGGVDYLLTLNCRHIANAHELPRIYDVLEEHGWSDVLICTPAEFLGIPDNDEESDS